MAIEHRAKGNEECCYQMSECSNGIKALLKTSVKNFTSSF